MTRDDRDWRLHLESATRSETDVRQNLTDVGVPGLTILWHSDSRRVGERVALSGLLSARIEPLSRLEPRFAPPHGGGPRPLADSHLSRRAVEFSRDPGDGLVLDGRLTRTSVTVDGMPLSGTRRLTWDEVERGVILLLACRVALVLHRMDPILPPPQSYGLVGESAAIWQVRREIQRVADQLFPVLLCGGSGTGKELAARAIHDAGPRREQPFLAVNMGAMPPELAAAELFGAAKGAYTGADRRRRGYFRRAAGGTLFLDEIGQAPWEVQVLLLRALETRQIQPVGARDPQTIDARVISATDANLETAMAEGRFHSPLFHRLSTYEIDLPPLSGRREDLGRLFRHFLRQELRAVDEAWRLERPDSEGRPWVPAELVARLARHAWPGNVRQLRNVVRQLVVGNRGRDEMALVPKVERLLKKTSSSSSARGLPPEDKWGVPREGDKRGIPAAVRPPQAPSPRPGYRDPAEVGEPEVRDALRAHRWCVQPAAAALNVSRTTLYALMDRHGVCKASDLSREEIRRCSVRCGGKLGAMAEVLEVSKLGLKLRMKELGLR